MAAAVAIGVAVVACFRAGFAGEGMVQKWERERGEFEGVAAAISHLREEKNVSF